MKTNDRVRIVLRHGATSFAEENRKALHGATGAIERVGNAFFLVKLDQPRAGFDEVWFAREELEPASGSFPSGTLIRLPNGRSIALQPMGGATACLTLRTASGGMAVPLDAEHALELAAALTTFARHATNTDQETTAS